MEIQYQYAIQAILSVHTWADDCQHHVFVDETTSAGG